LQFLRSLRLLKQLSRKLYRLITITNLMQTITIILILIIIEYIIEIKREQKKIVYYLKQM